MSDKKPPAIPHRLPEHLIQPVRSVIPKLPCPEDFPSCVHLNLSAKERTTDLAAFVCRKTLPQCIRVTKPFLVPGCDVTVNEGDVFMLQYIAEIPTIHVTDSKGKSFRLPKFARQEYEILPLDPVLDDTEFNTTEKLINANPLPNAVRVVEAHCSIHPDESQEVDDVIEIEGIEFDEERGKVLVGTNGSEHIRYSSGMNASRYTTMVSPNYHRMSELTARKFPQRVRIPDVMPGKGMRNVKRERILRFNRFSMEKCVIATRNGDKRIYSIPLLTPLSFESIEGTWRHVQDMLPALFPLVNTTWGVHDISQAAPPSTMESIPQPLDPVLQIWLNSWEGKTRAEKAVGTFSTNLKEQMTEMQKELQYMRDEVEKYKRKLEAALSDMPGPAPALPPRSRPHRLHRKSPPRIPLPPRPGQEGDDDDGAEYEDLEELAKSPTTPVTPKSQILPPSPFKDVHRLQGQNPNGNAGAKYWKQQYEVAIERKEKEHKEPDNPSPYHTMTAKSANEKNDSYEIPYVEIPLPERGNLEQMSVDDVGRFLRDIRLGQYAVLFARHSIDGYLLVNFDEDILISDLEMSKLHARKLMTEIKRRK